MESKLERRILKTQAKREQLDVITRPTCQRLTLSSNPRLTPVNRSCCWCVQVFAYLARAAIEQKRATVLLSLSLILSAYVAAFASAQAADRQSSTQWATDKTFQQSRKSPFSISWQAAPLRDRIGQLARQQGISIFLDRRVDPRTPINLTATNVTMEQLLLKICDQHQLGFCQFGDGFYLGPKPTAHRLLISSENAASAGRKTSNALLKKTAFDWPELSTPKQLLNSLAAEGELELENAHLLPHDMMTSGSIPPMTLAQRLRLLLIQFGLDYELKRNSRTLTLRPVSEMPSTASIRFSDANLSLKEFQKIKGQATKSRMRRNKRSITVTGPVEELVMARDFIVESFVPAAPTGSDQQFTLKVTSRRSAILAAIGKQLQMPVNTSLADPDAMQEVVSLSVANVSLQALLDQIMADSGATCAVVDGTIVVGSR